MKSHVLKTILKNVRKVIKKIYKLNREKKRCEQCRVVSAAYFPFGTCSFYDPLAGNIIVLTVNHVYRSGVQCPKG